MIGVELVGLMGDTLGVPTAAHAAQLAREGLLPQQDEVIALQHVVALLLGVAATTDPTKADTALISVASLPIQTASRLKLIQPPEIGKWDPASVAERAQLPPNPFEAAGAALRGEWGLSLMTVGVDRVVVAGSLEAGDQAYSITYAQRGAALPFGMHRLTEVYGDILVALGEAFNPAWPHPMPVPASAVQPVVLH